MKPETSKSWEVGARTQWLDRRITANLTLFDARYENFQAQGIETLPDGTVNYRLTNVGKLHNRGIELETSALVTEQFRTSFAAAYLDAEITDFPLAQCYPLQTAAQGCVGNPARQNLSGATPPQSPKWKLTATADYTIPLPAMPFEGVLQGVYSYQTTVNYGLNQDPQTVQKSYGILNLSAGIRDTSGHYEVTVFVNNVTDQRYYAHIFNSTATTTTCWQRRACRRVTSRATPASRRRITSDTKRAPGAGFPVPGCPFTLPSDQENDGIRFERVKSVALRTCGDGRGLRFGSDSRDQPSGFARTLAATAPTEPRQPRDRRARHEPARVDVAGGKSRPADPGRHLVDHARRSASLSAGLDPGRRQFGPG